MLFLDYFTFAALVLFSVYGFCHLAGLAYLEYRLVQNAKQHSAWMQWRLHR
jgi:hypothetical protein